MTDIVEFMRSHAMQTPGCDCERCEAARKAADEIERLLGELERNRGDLIIEADRANRAEAERDALLAILPRIREGVERWRIQHAPLSIPVRASDADILLADIDDAMAAKERTMIQKSNDVVAYRYRCRDSYNGKWHWRLSSTRKITDPYFDPAIGEVEELVVKKPSRGKK